VKTRIPKWAKPVVLGSKGTKFLYNTKFGLEGSSDRALFFCPMFDQKNVVDTTALGTGAGYRNFTLTTEKQWPAMLGDSPYYMFSWLVNSGLDTETELKQRYIWGPRTFKWEITNQETFPMQMKIFWASPRRDLDWNDTAYDSTTQSFMHGTDLNDVSARLFARDGHVTWGSGVLKTSLPISWTPFQSHSWCQYFKVRKVQTIKVDAGQCVVINRKSRKWVSINDIDVADTEYVARRNQLIPFIHIVGCPVYDSSAYRIVGTGLCRLSLVYTASHTWWTMNANTQAYKKVDLGAPAGDLTAANARYVSKPVAGAVAAV